MHRARLIAGVLIIAGVINRYEFCKFIYVFNAKETTDRRMQWFMRRLKAARGGVQGLTDRQCELLREGARAFYQKHVPEE